MTVTVANTTVATTTWCGGGREGEDAGVAPVDGPNGEPSPQPQVTHSLPSAVWPAHASLPDDVW